MMQINLGMFDAVPIPLTSETICVWVYPEVLEGKLYIECGQIVAKSELTLSLNEFSNSWQTAEQVFLPSTARIGWMGSRGIGILQHLTNQDFGLFIDDLRK